MAVGNVPEEDELPLPLDDVEVEGEGADVWGTTTKVMFRLHRELVALGSSCSGLLPVTAWNRPADADRIQLISLPGPRERQASEACRFWRNCWHRESDTPGMMLKRMRASREDNSLCPTLTRKDGHSITIRGPIGGKLHKSEACAQACVSPVSPDPNWAPVC